MTDAWHPAVNGVIRTIESLTRELEAMGHQVLVIGTDRFRTLPLPSYPEIRLAWNAWRLPAMIDAFAPDSIHIATEGPLGLAARRYCLRRKRPFTTAFHTRFPEYVASRLPVPLAWSYASLRRFHAPAAAVMVATPTLQGVLSARGFERLRIWTRGVDTELFRPARQILPRCPAPHRPLCRPGGGGKEYRGLPRAGAAGVEIRGRATGRSWRSLKRRHPGVHFVGYQHGEDLARYYAAADVFVFPSRTDTFGLVLLESLAAGVPVAAYPVAGPLDVIGASGVGCLQEDLGEATRAALSISAESCRAYALGFSWEASARQFADIAV